MSGIHAIAAIGLVLRLIVAIGFEQVHHPDEVFQYWEQAHRWVFGYGYIPWEYRFGIRSWLIPTLLAAPLYLCKLLHLDQPSFYIPFIQSLLCLASISVIYSAYWIGCNLGSERSGQLASLFTACWYELIYFAHKPTPEVLGAYCFLMAVAIATRPPRSSQSAPRRWGLLWGISSALTVALRLQYLPALAIVGLWVLWRRRWDFVAWGSLGGGLVLLGVGGLDWITWGVPFSSYVQNYLFNKSYGVSSLFGVSPWPYYLEGLAYGSGILPLLILLGSGPAVRRCWVLLAAIALVVLTHTWIPHKEYRFIFIIIPLWLIWVAIVLDRDLPLDGLARLLTAVRQVSWPRSAVSAQTLRACLGLVLVPLIGLGGVLLPPAQGLYAGFYGQPQWGKLYTLVDRQPTLISYLRLSQEPQLWGVLNLAYPWFATGGYSYLHRDVPIYFGEHRALWGQRQASDYVSHIICEPEQNNCPQEPEFECWQHLNNLEIWRATQVPQQVQTLDLDLKNVLQGGVDDRFQPQVTPHLR